MQDQRNSDHNVFNPKDKEALCEFAESVIKREGQGHILCSAVQLASWWHCFRAWMEETEKSVRKSGVFEVEQKPLFYSREHNKYLPFSQLKRVRHTNVVERSFQFYYERLGLYSMLANVCYSAHGNIKLTHVGWTNQIWNVLHLPQDERVIRIGSISSCLKEFLCPEQKNMLELKNVIHKCTKARGPVVDWCDSTFLVAKASILLLLHKRFIGYNLDWENVTSSLSQLVLDFAWKVQSKELDIIGVEDVQRAAFIFVKVIEEIDMQRRIDVLMTSAGFIVTQTFPLHIIYILSAHYMKQSLVNQTKSIPANLWTPRRWLRLDMFDVYSPLAVDCDAFGANL